MTDTHTEPELEAPDVAIEIVENEDSHGQMTQDPLGRLYYQDAYALDCPEDLTLLRDLGGWVSEVNSLRLALRAIEPGHKLLKAVGS